MMRFLRNTVLTLITLTLFPMILVGCSNNPSISEANTYLQVKSEQTKLDLFRDRVVASKDQLTEVPPGLLTDQTEPPPSLLGELTDFLEQNDCTDKQLSFQSKMNCYRVTRVKLINATRDLDRTRVQLYAGQRTVTQLVDNMKMLIEALDDTK